MKKVEIFGTKDPNIFHIIINTVSSSFFNILRKKQGTGYIIPAKTNEHSPRVMESSITINVIDTEMTLEILSGIAKESGFELKNKIQVPKMVNS